MPHGLGKLLRIGKRNQIKLGSYRFSWAIEKHEAMANMSLPVKGGGKRAFGQGPYKLHLGPGPNWVKPGDEWLTVDVDPARGDVVVDFGAFEGFPLADGTVSCIYGSHVFEHISIWTSQKVFNECYRVLRPGGYLRVIYNGPKKLDSQKVKNKVLTSHAKTI